MHLRVHACQHACQRRERGADYPGPADDALGLQPRHAGKIRVVSHRAHRAPGAAARQKKMQRHRAADGNHNRLRMQGRQAQPAEQHEGRSDAVNELLILRSPDQLHGRAQHQRHAERGDDRINSRQFAQRPVEGAVRNERRRHRQRNAKGQRRQRMQAKGPDRAERAIGAESHDIAMGEMREAQDAENHRNADRAHGVNAAKRQGGDEIEGDENAHTGESPGCPPPRNARRTSSLAARFAPVSEM